MSLRMINNVLNVRSAEEYCVLCGKKYGSASKTEEHIFPKWLQHKYALFNKLLNIPNFTRKSYKHAKINVCQKCNNNVFSKLESRISECFISESPHESLRKVSDKDIAVWIGKIFWLINRKSNSYENFRSKIEGIEEAIVPDEAIKGLIYVGLFLNSFALKKDFKSCYWLDQPHPSNYQAPFSLYRYRIDTRDKAHENFDYLDNTFISGCAIRCDDIGIICLFDGGLHKTFLAPVYNYIGQNALHPYQFSELAAHMFHDQTVLSRNACRVTYYWNNKLKSVIAEQLTLRGDNPYMQSNYDIERHVAFLSAYRSVKSNDVFDRENGLFFTSLRDNQGNFSPYPIGEEQLEEAIRTRTIKRADIIPPNDNPEINPYLSTAKIKQKL